MTDVPSPLPPALGPSGGRPQPPAAVQTGRRPDEPETGAFIPPPRAPRPRPAGGPWSGDDDGKFEPSGATRPSINPLSSALAALGNGVKVKLRRTATTLPACETGWTPWMDLGLPTPTADDVQDFILQKFGGGEFLILLRSDNSQAQEQDSIKISLMGDWIPQTLEGNSVKQAQLARGGTMPTLPPSGTSDAGMQVVTEAMKYAHEDKAQARDLSQKTAEAQSNALVQLATVLKPDQGAPRQGGSNIPELLAAISPMILAYLENQRAERQRAEDRAREDRAAAEARAERQMAEMRANNTPTALAKATELQMELIGKVAMRAVEQALAMSGKGDTEVGPLRAAFARLIGETGPMLAGLAGAVLPKLLSGLQGGGAPAAAPMLPPQGPGPMQPGTQQVPVFVPAGAPQANPGVPGPTQGQPAAAAPTGGHSDPSQPQGPSPTQPERAAIIWLAACAEWVGSKPEPAAAWQYPVEGMPMAVIFGMSPPAFRAAVQAIDPDVPGPMTPPAWVANMHPVCVEAAGRLDAALHGPTVTPGAEEWLRQFLDQGPWVEEEDPEDTP